MDFTNKRDDIHLSVVAVSRNDDHGKNLLYRMNQFLNAFVQQANRHQVLSELILVEWNPLQNKKKLAEVLSIPENLGCCTIRFIEFSQELHNSLENSCKIPLFQMIGKNIGIRRALGSFVLATNIDIIFSDPIMRFIKQNLKRGVLYRADRFDVPETIPDASQIDKMLAFCRQNVLRINTIKGTFKSVENLNWFSLKISEFKSYIQRIKLKIVRLFYCFFSFLKRKFFRFLYCCKTFSFKRLFFYSYRKFFEIGLSFKLNTVKSYRFLFRKIFNLRFKLSEKSKNNTNAALHTNACGDFTLLSREDWNSLRGYPEWPIFSWHLDSVFMYQAYQHKLIFKNLPQKMAIYHIDHEVGSGYSEEGASLLFKRLDDRGIPYLSDFDLDALRDSMLKSKEKVLYNDNDWGFSQLKLPETCFSKTSKSVLSV